MKKNFVIFIPTLVLVFAVQFFLVKFFVGRTNQQATNMSADMDTSLPHPSGQYEAKEVAQVLIYSLRNNDLPRKDSGVVTFWQFATARLRHQLRDKALVRPYLGEDLWQAVIDFDSYRITHSKVEKTNAVFEIEIVSHKRLTRQLLIALYKLDDVWYLDQMVKRL